MLVDLKTILSGTREGGYAVGLFNCVTLAASSPPRRSCVRRSSSGREKACFPARPCRTMPT